MKKMLSTKNGVFPVALALLIGLPLLAFVFKGLIFGAGAVIAFNHLVDAIFKNPINIVAFVVGLIIVLKLFKK